MTKQTEAAKSVPGLPPRHDSSIAIEEPGAREPGAVAFPPLHRLIITTTKGVYIWDVYGVTEIFRSGSEGIVAAKRIAIGRGMLAVADSQVVVLHEFDGGLQKSYRLKGSEVSTVGHMSYTSTDCSSRAVLGYSSTTRNQRTSSLQRRFKTLCSHTLYNVRSFWIPLITTLRLRPCL